MPETKLHSAGRIVLSFATDVLTAGGTAAVGAALGWLIFLGIAGLEYGRPRSGDFQVLPWVAVLGLMAGAIGGAFLRSAIGKSRSRQLWIFGFVVFGGIAGPLALIALIAYSMSGTGGW